MTTVQQLQREIQHLSRQDFQELYQWIVYQFQYEVDHADDVDWEAWDRQIEEDDRTGKLDGLMQKVLADIAHGHAKEL